MSKEEMMKILKIVNILALVLLIAGCEMFLEPQIKTDGNIAQVKVDIGGNARTVLPSIEGFSKYVISAEPGNGNANAAPESVTIQGDEYEGNIALPFGEWKITVTAYVDVEGTDYEAAKGSYTLNVNSFSHWITIPINMPVSGPDKKGTFNYKVNFTGGISTAVKLDTWPGADNKINNSTITNGTEVQAEVESGVYFLTVTAAYNSKTVTRNQIVHIYDKSPTIVEYTFTTADFAEELVTLSGTFSINIDGIPARVHSIDAEVSLNEYDRQYFYGIIEDNAWSIEMPPFSTESVNLVVTFYDSQDKQFTKLHILNEPVLADIPNFDINYIITTITVSGYADFGRFNENVQSAYIIIYDYNTDTFIDSASIDPDTYYWEVKLEEFKNSTQVYFKVEGNDNDWAYFEDYYYRLDENVNYLIHNQPISNIVLSADNRILLSGSVTSVTIDGEVPIHDPDPDAPEYYYVNVIFELTDENKSISPVYVGQVPNEWTKWISGEFMGVIIGFSIEAHSDFGGGIARNVANRTINNKVVTNINLSADVVSETAP